MNFTALLRQITQSARYEGQIVHVATQEPREAKFGDIDPALPSPLAQALEHEGIPQLYCHQAAAVEVVRSGRDAVIATGTASGKTLCYNLPIAEAMVADPSATALYVFPAKALAQDQLRALLDLSEAMGEPGSTLRPGTYDGDTTQHNRRKIRQSCNVILTNPDMLHMAILPHHARWARIFSSLRYVVLDEIHTYRGIFGSNVANVIRRLLRICAHYGTSPQFVCCSATIANPQALAAELIGREVTVIDDDGSPAGKRHFVLWNPPFVGRDQAVRRSANVEAQRLMASLIRHNVQTIVFTKARVVAELIYRYVRDALTDEGQQDLADRVSAYRGGYLPEERRQIEKNLFSGKLLGITSTTALELGIDVGSLDACLIVGFPGTIASTLQQAGRAGRKSSESLVVLLAYNDPIDQYLMRRPDYFFGQTPENAVIDAANPYMLYSHLACAAFEKPISPEDTEYFGEMAPAVAEILEEEGQVKRIEDQWYWSTPDYPAGQTGLRMISQDTFTIIDRTGGRNETLGQVDGISAPELVYPEAVYLHAGETYLVRNLDLEGKVAYVEQADVDYYTQPVLWNDILVNEEQCAKDHPGARVCFGDATVTWATAGFTKRKFYSTENLGMAKLDLPPQEIRTTALWLVIAPETLAKVSEAGLKPAEGLAGVRNLFMVVLPMLSMCDQRDVSGNVDSKNTGQPTIFMYDRYPGGLGFCEKGYELIDDLLTMARRLVDECPCDEGCPSCVALVNLRPPIHGDPDIFSGWAIPNKQAARVILREMTG